MSDSNKNPHSLIPTSEEIDENALSFTDRLGLAWCRLNCGEWDDFLGPCPDGIANGDVMGAISEIIGMANISRCWWLFALGKTETEWVRWYITDRFSRKSQNPQ